MAAIVLTGTPEDRTRIHRRSADDLPAHIKGTATFKDYRGQSSTHRYKTGYYITTADGKKRAVEFLTVNQQDAWYFLEENDLGRFVTSTSKKVPELIANRYLGFWDITDP